MPFRNAWFIFWVCACVHGNLERKAFFSGYITVAYSFPLMGWNLVLFFSIHQPCPEVCRPGMLLHVDIVTELHARIIFGLKNPFYTHLFLVLNVVFCSEYDTCTYDFYSTSKTLHIVDLHLHIIYMYMYIIYMYIDLIFMSYDGWYLCRMSAR